jgi:hypothetical protein
MSVFGWKKFVFHRYFCLKESDAKKVQDFLTKLLITFELTQYNIFSKFSLTSSKGLINCRKLRLYALCFMHNMQKIFGLQILDTSAILRKENFFLENEKNYIMSDIRICRNWVPSFILNKIFNPFFEEKRIKTRPHIHCLWLFQSNKNWYSTPFP